MSRACDRRTLIRAAGAGAIGLALGSVLTTDSAGSTAAPLLQRAAWGAYASREPFPDASSHFELARLIGAKFKRMSWFSTWGATWPTKAGQQAAAGGYDVMLAWQPTKDGRAPIRFNDIVAGVHDAYLTRFFTAAAGHPGKVTIRFAHEPNGTGYPWSAAFEGTTGKCLDSPAEYVAGWRYVVEFYRRMSPHLPRRNIQFCWCITTRDRGGFAAEEYYPGNNWVDILGVDVYNGYGGYWASPVGLLSAPYRRLESLSAGSKPIWIPEIGCREPTKTESGVAPDPTKSKAQWLDSLFRMTEYPLINTVYFFHAERAHDWRLDSSPGALAVCRKALAGRG